MIGAVCVRRIWNQQNVNHVELRGGASSCHFAQECLELLAARRGYGSNEN